jgi:hypothetical protein
MMALVKAENRRELAPGLSVTFDSARSADRAQCGAYFDSARLTPRAARSLIPRAAQRGFDSARSAGFDSARSADCLIPGAAVCDFQMRFSALALDVPYKFISHLFLVQL